MAKRRTRKQKEKAKHQFAVSWKPAKLLYQNRQQSTSKSKAKTTTSEAIVKGQFKKRAKALKLQKSKKEKAKDTAKDANLASIKLDIRKSLFLASLILSLEIMIYLWWSR